MSMGTVAPAAWSVGRKTLAIFIATGVIVIAAPAASYFTTARYVRSERQAQQSTEIVSALQQLRAAYSNVVASQYALASSGDSAFTLQRDRALGEVRLQLRALQQRQTLGTSEGPQRLQMIRSNIDGQAMEFSAGPELSTRPATLPWAQRHEQSITLGMIDDAIVAEAALSDQREAATRQAAHWLYTTISLAALLTLLALAWLLISVRRDLLERDWFEGQLQEANQLLESLLENLPAMVFAKDAASLRFVRINRMAERIMGYTREQLLGRGDHDFFPAEQADYFNTKDRETLAKGEIVEIPHEEIDTGDHGRRTLHTFKVPIRGKDGKPSLLLGISLDITQQKAAERRVVGLNNELIRQSQMLQSSNQELESFCYSVSHDLRAPLRAINGYARLLEQEYANRFDAEGIRYLHTICNACDRMAHLIDDLLEFSRIGRQTLEHEPVDMQTVVSKVINDVTAGRTAPLPVIETGDLPSIRGDRNMVQQVWLNLIDNAVKYTGGVNSPHINIGAERKGNEVVYSVSDNGIGFDMQYADKLFGVFQRLHASPEYPGTGVGLAIAQRIVTRHGGRIWASSEPGLGTTFSFALPAEKAC
ncbi:MAG TPA: ATP-binding protein [Povalibacter sp.]